MIPLVLVTALACADGAASPSAPEIAVTDPTLLRVEAQPDAFTLKPGAARRLVVTYHHAHGRVLPADASVRYQVLDPAVAQVSATGVVTARVAGVGRVVVRRGTLADTSRLTVTTAPVARVTLPGEDATVAAGDSLAVRATVRDAAGTTLTDRALAWASSDTTVARVHADAHGKAVVRAVAAGTTMVTATSEGHTGALRVSVPAPATSTPTGPVVAECASPKAGWLWCDDFEVDRRSRYFERDSAGGKFVRAASVGASRSYGMRARFDSGTVSAGSLKVAFGRTPSTYFKPVDAGTADYRDIYWRWYVRYEPTWQGGAGHKMSRATGFANSGWAQSMIAHVWGGSDRDGMRSDHLVIDPASGTDAAGLLVTTKYNDFANLRWLGAALGRTPAFGAAHVGQWQCVEARARLNDAGRANGLFELWLNGEAEAQRTGLNFLGAYSAYGINAVFLENYWNTGSPKRQERYFDNFVVSTQRIGC